MFAHRQPPLARGFPHWRARVWGGPASKRVRIAGKERSSLQSKSQISNTNLGT